MPLTDEIWKVVNEMPLRERQIIGSTVTGIHALCALADALMPEFSLGAVAVSVVGAEYQDKAEAEEVAERVDA